MPLVSNSSHALELLKQLDQSLSQSAHKGDQQAVSYTHLTLPTKLEV